MPFQKLICLVRNLICIFGLISVKISREASKAFPPPNSSRADNVVDGKKEFVRRFCPDACQSPPFPPPFILLSNTHHCTDDEHHVDPQDRQWWKINISAMAKFFLLLVFPELVFSPVFSRPFFKWFLLGYWEGIKSTKFETFPLGGGGGSRQPLSFFFQILFSCPGQLNKWHCRSVWAN